MYFIPIANIAYAVVVWILILKHSLGYFCIHDKAYKRFLLLVMSAEYLCWIMD